MEIRSHSRFPQISQKSVWNVFLSFILKKFHNYRVLTQTMLNSGQFGVANYDKSIFRMIGDDHTALNGRKAQNVPPKSAVFYVKN